MHRDQATGLWVPTFGPLISALALPIVTFWSLAAFNLVQGYRAARDPLRRRRIQYLLLAMVPITVGMVANLIPATRPYPVDLVTSALSAFLIAYAILRYKLLDINIVVRRGLVYTALTTILGVSYFSLIYLAVGFFHLLTGPQILILSFIVAIITATVAQPLRDKVQDWIDRVFFREQYNSSAMIQRLSRNATSVLDLEKLTNMILDDVTSTMHIEWAALFLEREPWSEPVADLTSGSSDPSGQHDRKQDFYLAAQRGLETDAGLRLGPDHIVHQWLLHREQVLGLDDLAQRPRHRSQGGQTLENWALIDARLFIPLQARGELIGALALGSRRSQQPYSPDDELTLKTLANQTAVAIDNARLHEAERQRSAELARSNAFITALSQVAAHIEVTPTPDQVLETLGYELKQLGLTCFLALLEPDTFDLVGHYTSIEPATLAAVEQETGQTLRGFRFALTEQYLRQIVELGQALILPDLPSAVAALVSHLPEASLSHIGHLLGAPTGLGAFLPLKSGEQVLGIVLVWGPDLRERDVPALTVFASQVAVAFENARLYERTQQEVAARIQAEEQILASLKEKEVLLKEIHHRVKNNLQVISSLLSLQSAHVQEPHAVEAFQESQYRIRSMALIHERLHQSQDLSQVDLADYVRNLAAYLFRMYGARTRAISLNVRGKGIFLEIDMAVSCGLLLNELISNALKHAFPGDRSGEICIGLEMDGDRRVALTVSDDGIGMPADLDPQTAESLGLQIVQALVEQLEGTLEIDWHRGTSFKITFAASENRS